MKRILTVLCAAVTMLSVSACASGSGAESSQTAVPDYMEVVSDENVPQAYADVAKAYFEAIQNDDYDAYAKTVYPPYLDAYGAYLQKKDSDVEKAFHKMTHVFDEDGYESWRLTRLELRCKDEPDADGFFTTYQKDGIFDDAFIEAAKKDAKEYQNVVFSLSALYAGDEEPVTVVQSKQLFMIQNDTGVYLFG